LASNAVAIVSSSPADLIASFDSTTTIDQSFRRLAKATRSAPSACDLMACISASGVISALPPITEAACLVPEPTLTQSASSPSAAKRPAPRAI